MVSHKRSLSGDPITIYKYSLWGTGKINTRKEKKLLKLAGDVDTNTSRYLLATDRQENSPGGVPSVVKFRNSFSPNSNGCKQIPLCFRSPSWELYRGSRWGWMKDFKKSLSPTRLGLAISNVFLFPKGLHLSFLLPLPRPFIYSHAAQEFLFNPFPLFFFPVWFSCAGDPSFTNANFHEQSQEESFTTGAAASKTRGWPPHSPLCALPIPFSIPLSCVT